MINKFRYRKPQQQQIKDTKEESAVNDTNSVCNKNRRQQSLNVSVLDNETKQKLKVSVT